jgi:hypothetical protein
MEVGEGLASKSESRPSGNIKEHPEEGNPELTEPGSLTDGCSWTSGQQRNPSVPALTCSCVGQMASGPLSGVSAMVTARSGEGRVQC